MTSAASIEATIEVFDKLVDQLEQALDDMNTPTATDSGTSGHTFFEESYCR